MCTCWNTILLGLLAVQVLVVHVVSLTANKFSFAVLVTSALAALVDISSQHPF